MVRVIFFGDWRTKPRAVCFDTPEEAMKAAYNVAYIGPNRYHNAIRLLKQGREFKYASAFVAVRITPIIV